MAICKFGISWTYCNAIGVHGLKSLNICRMSVRLHVLISFKGLFSSMDDWLSELLCSISQLADGPWLCYALYAVKEEGHHVASYISEPQRLPTSVIPA